jgi:hypothetical protein
MPSFTLGNGNILRLVVMGEYRISMDRTAEAARRILMTPRRKPASPHSKVVVQLDEKSHALLARLATENDRTIRDQARYLLKKSMGLLP